MSIRFESSEIHAVLGENGAGKSTLVSVLAGFALPDSGEVRLDNQPLPLGQPSGCAEMGIQLVHQHFTLVPEFSGEENLALGNLRGLMGPLRIQDSISTAQEIADRLGWKLRLRDLVSTYSVGEQQRLEILRALSLGGDVVIFDEPTAVLAPDEVDDLLQVLRRLRDEGKVVILIAHKLSEVFAVADRITVLRKGKWISTDSRADVNAPELASRMVGEMPSLVSPRGFELGHELGLTVSNLNVFGSRGDASVRDVSMVVNRGEILGIGGVDGNGQVELAEALVGVRRVASGTVNLGPSTGTNANRVVAYIPQDRQRDGLAMGMSVSDNLLVSGHRRPELSFHGFLRIRAIRMWAVNLIARFSIKVDSPSERVSGLSGGNGQKVVVSRVLDGTPSLLVAVNPTRGLDVKATLYVHQKIKDAASTGCAVVLISTDMDELAALADRRVFISRGKLSDNDHAESLVGGGAF